MIEQQCSVMPGHQDGSSARPFQEIDAWVARYRSLWEARLDRFGAALARKQRARVAKHQETIK